MPQTSFSDNLHRIKYRGKGESFEEAMNRFSAELADDSKHYHKTRNVVMEQKFLPPGRAQSAVGSSRNTTPWNCFVSGTIEDSLTDGHGSIMARALEAAATMRMGGGIGYDFSTLRPRGALINKLQSHSSGPISFMQIYNAICLCIASSGHRRGAQMGVLRVDHPDIEEFIHAKQNQSNLTGFNVSIAVTNEFMEALARGSAFPLRFEGRVYREIDPAALWDKIMRSTWDWAEPGVLFIDHINNLNPLSYCETIAATNPCGEQPLPPFGACLLGSWNLVKYVVPGLNPHFDLEELRRDIPPIVRAMDNIINIGRYPLYEHEKESHNKRRMGIGVAGAANAIEALGHPYGSGGFIRVLDEILRLIELETLRTSIELGKEKGSFPLLSEEYTKTPYFRTRFENDLAKDVNRHGLRNSHRTSIAPTGTISLCADNISSGIEPVFAYTTRRQINLPDDEGGPQFFDVPDYGVKFLGVKGKTYDKVSASDHLSVLVTASHNVDSAVSKTCNVPSNIPWNDFKELYKDAWEAECKGLTTFRPGGGREGIMTEGKEGNEPELELEEKEKLPIRDQLISLGLIPDPSCEIDPVTGQRSCE